NQIHHPAETRRHFAKTGRGGGKRDQAIVLSLEVMKIPREEGEDAEGGNRRCYQGKADTAEWHHEQRTEEMPEITPRDRAQLVVDVEEAGACNVGQADQIGGSGDSGPGG